MFQYAARDTVAIWQLVHARTVELLPAAVASLLAIGIGVLIGWLARRVVVRLLQKRSRQWAPMDPLGWGSPLATWSRPLVIGLAVQWSIIFGSTIVAFYALDARLASALAERVLLYVPRLASGMLLLAAGVLLSRFVGRTVLIAAVNHELPRPRLLASATRTAVIVLAVAIALEHTGIGERTVLVAFAILFGGLTLTASIALGRALENPLRSWFTSQAPSRPGQEREEEALHHM